jgi:hypothetical protein
MSSVTPIAASPLPSRQAILLIWLWISVPMLVGLVVTTILLGFPYQMIIMAVSTILMSGCLVWARTNINQVYFTQSILALITALLIISSMVAILFPGGISALLLAIVVSLAEIAHPHSYGASKRWFLTT